MNGSNIESNWMCDLKHSQKFDVSYLLKCFLIKTNIAPWYHPYNHLLFKIKNKKKGERLMKNYWKYSNRNSYLNLLNMRNF